MPKSKKVTEFRVQYFRNLSNSLAFRSNLYFPTALFARAPFELRQFDLIHLHDFYTLANIWLTLWARLYHMPYVISVHGCLESERRKEKSSFKNYFLQFFGISMLNHAAKVVATSRQEVKAYRALGISPSKIVSIGHGVNRSEFETKIAKAICRRQLHIPAQATVFTFLGRLHFIKGVDLLLTAFAKLKDANAYVVVAGSDEGMLPQLKTIVKQEKLTKRVLFLGPTTGVTKAKLFKATDIFVYPSRSEGFSLGILEAASIGLPLLITKACHFPAVAKSQSGIVCTPTVDSLASSLQVMSGLSVRQRGVMGANAAHLIAQNYSMQAIGNQLEKLYTSVLTETVRM